MAGTYKTGHLIEGTVYRVVRHIGTGGMGSLYEVEDTTVGRRYVLKTLHPELIDRSDLAVRMREEARALGILQHPHIVQVITAGVTADTLRMPYYVMELLVGQNLRTVIDARKGTRGVGAGHAYRIAIDMLDALQLAHDNAMVHRDVKPENIFLHRGPTGTVTKLLDFGIVRMLNREATLTRGKFIGTLKYSSPEQISGTRPVGPSSDIYSMGIVLYELLAQRGPFDDLHDGFKIGAAHVEKPPPPPSQFAPVDPMVERLVLQALEKDPAARPASAGGFAAELRRALELFEAMPSQATDVELLSARHPIDLATAPTTLDGPATVAEPAVGRREVMADTVKAEPARPPLDREAPTRIQGKSDPRVIVAPNDTQVGAGLPRGATLRMPDASARASDTGPGELGPKRTQRFVTTVTTRPKPQSRAAVAVVVAAILAIAMIAGAIVIVRGRFGGK